MRAASEWRVRYGAAMNRTRTIERQAAGLRASMARLASGECDRGEVDSAIAAMRDQLTLAERLAEVLQATGHSPVPIDSGPTLMHVAGDPGPRPF